MIFVTHHSNKARRSFAKRIFRQQGENLRRAAQQMFTKGNHPWVLLRRSERGKPELPVESWLMRRHPSWPAIQRAGFVRKLVRAPLCAIVAAFEDQFGSRMRHDREQTVVVERTKWTDDRADAVHRRR